MKRMRMCSPVAALVLVATILTVPAGATVRTWDGGAGDSFWQSPNNWSPNGYSSSDDLIVTFGAPITNGPVFTDSGGSITLSGPTTVADFGGWNRLHRGWGCRQ